jgi:hypothetical protein
MSADNSDEKDALVSQLEWYFIGCSAFVVLILVAIGVVIGYLIRTGT